jgi:hypothetical protein
MSPDRSSGLRISEALGLKATVDIAANIERHAGWQAPGERHGRIALDRCRKAPASRDRPVAVSTPFSMISMNRKWLFNLL